MLHSLAARVLIMATETGDDIAACPLLLTECINYVLRKMPASLRTSMAFNIQIEVMSVMYDAVYLDFGNAPEFPPAPVDNYGAHFGL
jgi:hypothetical protein